MSWPNVPLASCARIVSGATPRTSAPEYWGGDIRWITPADISDQSRMIVDDTPRRITDAGLASCSAEVLPPRSVLLSSRAPIGHTAINSVPMATNQGFKSFVPDQSRLIPEYLLFWLRHNRASIEAMGNGATFKEVSKSVVERIELPLPPLPEQRRIAAILDKADAIRARRRAGLADADALPLALFAQVGSATERRGTLGDLIKVKSGQFLPAAKMAVHGEHPVYGGNGVNGAHDAYMFEEPQICIGRVGFYCGAVHRTRPKSWITDNALYVSEMSDGLHPGYLEWALRAAKLNRYADQAAQPLISGARLKPVIIPLPDEDGQRRFAERVARFRNVEDRARAALADADALYRSLAARAFRGEL